MCQFGMNLEYIYKQEILSGFLKGKIEYAMCILIIPCTKYYVLIG